MLDRLRQGSCPVSTDFTCFSEACFLAEMMNWIILTIRHQAKSSITVFKPPFDDILVQVRANLHSLALGIHAKSFQPPLSLGDPGNL